MIIREKHDKKTYQDDDIPSDDDNDEPAGNHFNDGEGNESGEGQELVGNRVEVSAQFGPLVSQARDETVQPICDPCDRKSEKSPVEIFIDDEDDEDRGQQDSYQREDIGQVHRLHSSAGFEVLRWGLLGPTVMLSAIIYPEPL
jgi:hypothetical protein